MRVLEPDEIEQARASLVRFLPPTPLRRSFALRPHDVWLKLECWQPTGSFKVRGALHHLRSIPEEERARGVVAASAGNHALGLAWAAEVLGGGVPVTLFLPENAPSAKVDKLRTFPVRLRQVGATYEDAQDAALGFAAETGARYVHAFEDPLTAAGQGTVGLEILEQLPDVERIVVPVGGGGLISATAVAVKAKTPQVKIVAVQAKASPSLPESLARGTPLLRYPAGPTLADGVAGGIGEIVFRHRALLDEVVVVPERALEDAIVALLTEDQVVAEGAGALGVGALRCGGLDPEGGRTVVVVTGGNIDAVHLRRLLAQPTCPSGSAPDAPS
ncbi:MAG TPA: threonine/serine dehydratase [Candidatus Polarisedimenticolaceae bacterium]|nr:threonine/serine dehydratase [Candidatus Polarisedimenticolaceae bacterium]